MTPTAGQRPRLDALTSLRGLAATWVVLFHFQDVVSTLGNVPAPLLRMVREGHMAVDLFFILSGFVLGYNHLHTIRLDRWTCVRFWLLRFARIYPAHVVGLIAVLPMIVSVRFLGLKITEEGYTLATFVQHLTLTQAWVPHMKLSWNYPAWSVSSEWLAYLLFPVIAAAVRRCDGRWCWVILAISCSCSLAIGSLATPEAPYREVIRVLTAFPVGVALCRLREVRHLKFFAPWFTFAAAALLVTILSTPNSVHLVVMGLFCILVLGLADLGERWSRWLTTRPLLWLGELSYSLYISHALVQKVLNELLPARSIASLTMPFKLLSVGAYAACLVGAAFLLWRFVERPAQEAIKHRVDRALRRTETSEIDKGFGSPMPPS